MQEDRERGLLSVHHTLSVLLLHSQGKDFSHSLPAPAWGPSQGRRFSTNFSNVSPSPLHELLQHGSFPWGAVIQEQTAPTWVPHGVTSPASKPASVWAPLFPLIHRFSQKPAPVRAPTGSQPPSGIYLLWHGVLPGLWVEADLLHCGSPWAAGEQPASPWSSPQAARKPLLRHLEHLLPLLLH